MFRDLNKYGLLISLVLTFTILSACGKSESPSTAASPSAAASPSQTPTATQDASTRVYKDSFGHEVKIPVHPQRVITTQYLPEMLAAGLKPIGSVSHSLTSYAVKDQVEGIQDVGPANDPNLEKLLILKPDLIIATEWDEKRYDDLSLIAPTVIVKWEGNDAFKHFKDIAEVLGQQNEEEQWIANFEKKGEEARVKLASYVKEGETFGVVVIGGYEKGQLRVYGNGNVGYTLFDTLKFPMTDFVKQEWAKGGHELGMKISLEKLPEYASADRLFVVRFDNDPDFLKQLDESSLWKNLPAVKNNKVYVVNSDLWFSYDVTSFDVQLDDAVKMLDH